MLIDRNRVMFDYIENLGRKDSYKAKYEALVKAVDDAPTIDAEPVRHGRWMWVDQPDGRTSVLTCSACGGTEWASETSNYCPNCGAKMDLEVREDA